MKLYRNVLFVSLSLSLSQAELQLHNEPIIWENPPKPNILMILDDSASMETADMPGGHSRISVLQEVTQSLIVRYRNGANIGLSGLGYNSPVSVSFFTSGARMPLKMAISDVSPAEALTDPGEINFRQAENFTDALPSDGNTPLAFALYEATKYFRGLKIFAGYNKADRIFDESHHPVQYRCQQNHIIMMSDSGGANEDTLYQLHSSDMSNGKVSSLNSKSTIDNIAARMWNDIDLRDYPPSTKPLAHLKSKDMAGKPWKDANDPGSKKLPIYFHGIFFGTQAQGSTYTAFSKAAAHSNGVVSFAHDTDTLSLGFHKIFQKIFPTKSNGYIVRNAHVNSQDILQYRTIYDANDWTGKLIAEKYLSLKEPFEQVWNTDETMAEDVTAGKFYTFDKNNQVELTAENLNSVADINAVTDEQVRWLKGESVANLRPRMYALADSINSKLYHIGKYERFMNTHFLSGNQAANYDEFYEGKQQNSEDLLIFGSNDGLINFFKAGASGGVRKYAYFPSFFASQLDEITNRYYTHNFKVDGPMSFFDMKTDEAIKTIGLVGMGAGYKGLVAFNIFSASSNGKHSSNDLNILYEITSETTGFKNLGYTYSQFSFFMDAESEKGGYMPTAVFGNGYGSDTNVSSLFMIHAQGEKSLLQKEIILSNQSGTINGASSPAIVITQNNQNGFHKLERIYVGDYAGRLYRITFDAQGKETVTLLFEDPEHNPITTKPVVKYEDGNYWVMFGTGSLLDVNLDKGEHSKKTHNFYGIKDNDSVTKATGPLPLEKLLMQELTRQSPDSSYMSLSSHKMTDAHHGWYIPLTLFGEQTGERVVDNPVIYLDDYIHFASIGINEGDPDDPCLGDRIFGSLVFADFKTGGAADSVFIDTNNDDKVNSSDPLGIMGIALSDTATGVLNGEGFTDGDALNGNSSIMSTAGSTTGTNFVNDEFNLVTASHKDKDGLLSVVIKNTAKGKRLNRRLYINRVI